MKKLLMALLAAAGLSLGVRAEGTGTKYNSGFYNVYQSSDALSSTTGQQVVEGSRILHSVIISSPAYTAGVSVSTTAVFQIFDGVGANAAAALEVNLSTWTLSNGPMKWDFDIAMSSGIWTDYSGSDTTGKVTLIYGRPKPAAAQQYRVWSSSYMVADTAVHNITGGPVLLHSISVLTKGTGTSILSIYDSRETTSPTAERKKAAIDLTDATRTYNYDIMLSSGMTLQASGAGTVNPYFVVLYKKNPSSDYEIWDSSYTTGTATTIPVATGSGQIFGGVVNGDSVSGSTLKIYDSNAQASGLLTTIDGSASFDRRMYDVQTSSGITYTSSGNGLYTILWKRRK